MQVSRVDLDGRKIDFRLVREGEELATRAMKDKGLAEGGRVPPAKAAAKGAAKKAGKTARSPLQTSKGAAKKAAAKAKGHKVRR